MSTIEQIEAILQQYKNILKSYKGFGRLAIDTGHREDAPEYGFDRKQMANPDSNLLAMVGRLFIGTPLTRALQQIDFWRVMYIEVQETGNTFSFEGTPEHQQWKALGQTFLDNARAMAERWCNRGEQSQGAGGIDHPTKVQRKKVQTEIEDVPATPTRGRGRPKETLKDKMINDADGKKLQKIHKTIARKKGKDAALVILACIKKGWMDKPTFSQVTKEFGDIGSRAGYNNYLKENMFTTAELQGAINSLD